MTGDAEIFFKEQISDMHNVFPFVLDYHQFHKLMLALGDDVFGRRNEL